METRRFFRRLRGAAVWASLGIFVATVLVAWVQVKRPGAAAFYHRDYDAGTRTLRTVCLSAHEGGVWFDWAYHFIGHDESHEKWSRLMRDRPHWWQRFDAPGGYTADRMPLGFYFHAGRNASRTRYIIFRLPYWFVAAATALPPGLAMVRWERVRRRRRGGLCLRCGYDLRGSPQCCPECGTGVGPDPADGVRGWR